MSLQSKVISPEDIWGPQASPGVRPEDMPEFNPNLSPEVVAYWDGVRDELCARIRKCEFLTAEDYAVTINCRDY